MKTPVRSLAAVAALLVLVLALPVAGQGIVITSPSGGTQTSVVGTTSSCSVGAPDSANSVCLGSNAITGEGATADTSETVLAFGDASADNTLTLKGTAAGVEATVTTGALLTGAGTGTGRVSVGGVLCSSAPVQATTGTSEEILATCAVPANTLGAAGSRLRIRFTALTASNVNPKTIYVRIGTGTLGSRTLIYQSAALSVSNQDIYSIGIEAVYRSSSAGIVGGVAQYVQDASAATASTAGSYMNRSASIAWTSALDVTLSALTSSGAGDLTLLDWAVEVLP